MKLLLDMNLPPRWAVELQALGHDALHWSTVGSADASDALILQRVAALSSILLTHDLDFGSILAASGARAPSVIVLRADAVDSAQLVQVSRALVQFEQELETGALVVVDAKRTRARLLPLRPQ